MTVASPSGVTKVYETSRMIYEQATISALHQVTITAGLEKILAVITITSSASAQTAASASSGLSETSDSASATSSSIPASTSLTTESCAETGAFRNISLAAFCGLIALMLGAVKKGELVPQFYVTEEKLTKSFFLGAKTGI